MRPCLVGIMQWENIKGCKQNVSKWKVRGRSYQPERGDEPTEQNEAKSKQHHLKKPTDWPEHNSPVRIPQPTADPQRRQRLPFLHKGPQHRRGLQTPQWCCSPVQQRPPRMPRTDHLPPSCPGRSAWLSSVSSLTARLSEEPTASPKPGGWWPGLHPSPTQTPALPVCWWAAWAPPAFRSRVQTLKWGAWVNRTLGGFYQMRMMEQVSPFIILIYCYLL